MVAVFGRLLRRRVAIGVAVVLTLAIAGLAALILRDKGDDAGPHRVSTGGFALRLPGGWRQAPLDEASAWFRAERQPIPGVPTAWLWLNRWSGGESTMDEDWLRQGVEGRGGDVEFVDDVRIAGRVAKAIRYQKAVGPVPGRLPGPRLSSVVYHVEAFGQHYQIGFTGWPSPPLDAADRVIASLELFEPRGWRTVTRADDGFSVEVPASWNAQTEDLFDGAILGVFPAPGPPDTWFYVMRGGGSSVAESVTLAITNIEAQGGEILGRDEDTLADRAAVRLDFLFPNEGRPDLPAMAHDVEWFVEDGNGGVLVVAVGRTDADSTIAEDLAARFEFH